MPEFKELKAGLYGYQLKEVPDADVYVLQQRPERVLTRLVPELQSLGKKVVCETDDFYGSLPANHPARGAIDEAGVRVLHRVYSLADALTVSTPFLEREYRYLNSNIHLLPNFLDWDMWSQLKRRDWKRLRVGWMGNSRFRPDDVQVLRGVLGPWLRRHPEVDFVAAGDPAVHEAWDVPEEQRLSFPLVQFHELPTIMRFDIGLVPLAENRFNEAKSHLKGLEYNACGVPFVASPSEPYRGWTVEGSNGFLARRPRDWVRHLDALAGDAVLRKRMAVASRRRAARHTIQRYSYLWEQLYASLLGDRFDGIARDAITRGALQKPSELAAFLRYVGEPKIVVEIGSATGGMFFALAQVAADDALLISIDLPFGDFGGEDAKSFKGTDRYGREDTPVETMRSYLREGQRAEFLRADSQDAATRATLERILAGRKADLIFIDGDHSYEGVRRDFELYGLAGRIIAFHDILEHPLEPRTQVHRLWGELRPDYVAREFVHHGQERGWGQWGGIGVLELGAADEQAAA